MRAAVAGLPRLSSGHCVTVVPIDVVHAHIVPWRYLLSR